MSIILYHKFYDTHLKYVISQFFNLKIPKIDQI